MTIPTRPSARRFTGYHAALILICFFGVVIAVNLVMARFALSTFGGTIVDNSYVASQKYNDWLAQSRAQEEHGWQVADPVRSGKALQVSVRNARGEPLTGASITTIAHHPVGRGEAVALEYVEVSPGQYASTHALPDGRWKLKTSIAFGGLAYNRLSEVR